jgi:hypothetical protein
LLGLDVTIEAWPSVAWWGRGTPFRMSAENSQILCDKDKRPKVHHKMVKRKEQDISLTPAAEEYRAHQRTRF